MALVGRCLSLASLVLFAAGVAARSEVRNDMFYGIRTHFCFCLIVVVALGLVMDRYTHYCLTNIPKNEVFYLTFVLRLPQHNSLVYDDFYAMNNRLESSERDLSKYVGKQ